MCLVLVASIVKIVTLSQPSLSAAAEKHNEKVHALQGWGGWVPRRQLVYQNNENFPQQQEPIVLPSNQNGRRDMVFHLLLASVVRNRFLWSSSEGSGPGRL